MKCGFPPNIDYNNSIIVFTTEALYSKIASDFVISSQNNPVNFPTCYDSVIVVCIYFVTYYFRALLVELILEKLQMASTSDTIKKPPHMKSWTKKKKLNWLICHTVATRHR